MKRPKMTWHLEIVELNAVVSLKSEQFISGWKIIKSIQKKVQNFQQEKLINWKAWVWTDEGKLIAKIN